MYVTINDVIGEKTIDLSYPIRNFSSSKEHLGARSVEIAVVSLFSKNVQYRVTGDNQKNNSGHLRHGNFFKGTKTNTALV